ncbi:DUF2155 domain-containing protein [Swingsia samuiensis]|uniref:DUF2155 domain-containing protein n=1 Tax=Swingsia samuiensis TaxID=1293412 RepID=A0A4Y6UHH3_9PROT|nr:DUF2155 domain-containing protein [Swingsia samuiensis]QDH16952.1 DUF2155 domain-containing protein [Swingsia samuiensis]
MAAFFRSSCLLLGFVGLSSVAYGGTGIAPPVMYPANTWQGHTQAVVRVLDRLDFHLEELTVPVGGSASYKTLSVQVETCLSRPETLPEDTAVLLHLHDQGDASRKPFDGWMFKNEPSLASYGSPLYDVRVVGCSGGTTAPQAGPLPEVKAPSITNHAVTNDEGGDNNASSSASASAPARNNEEQVIPLAPETHAPISLAPTTNSSPAPEKPQNDSLPPPEADPGLQ